MPQSDLPRPTNRYGHIVRNWSMILVSIALVAALSYEVKAIYSPSGISSSNASAPLKGAAGLQNQSTPSVSIKSVPISVSHIFIVVMENQPYSAIAGSSSAPYLNSLIKNAGLAKNYSAVSHPSLPNYLALTSASTDGTTTDCSPPSSGCIVSVANIADEIEASGRSWRQYAENMPAPCYAQNYGSLYVTKHAPFLYYNDIINNTTRCNAHIVPYSYLANDLSLAKTTPDFAFITPNLCNDMHSCSINTGDNWLSTNLPPILNSAAFKSTASLLIITWDEGNLSDNTVGAIFTGSAARAAYQSNIRYNHYSLLSTIEHLWGLKALTANDKNAIPMTDLVSAH